MLRLGLLAQHWPIALGQFHGLNPDPFGGTPIWASCWTLDKKEIAVRGSGKGLFWVEEVSLGAV